MRFALAHSAAALAAAAVTFHADARPRVAIVAAAANTANPNTDDRFTDARDHILATGRVCDVAIFSSTRFPSDDSLPHGTMLTLEHLRPYDAVLTWSNDSHQDSEHLGDLLADYADAGNGVVTAVFTNTTTNEARQLKGRWEDEGYFLIQRGSGFRSNPNTPSMGIGDRLDPEHPILDGVETFASKVTLTDAFGFYGAFRPVTTNTVNGGEPIALWEDGALLVVVDPARPNLAELGFLPVSDLVNEFYYWDHTTDGGLLMANALVFTAGAICEADWDRSGDVTVDDLLGFLGAFRGEHACADLDGDGQIGVNDLLGFLGAFRQGCP